MDPLTDVLQRMRLRANIFLHARFCGAWVVNTSGSGKATFHVVARGDCWLHMPGAAPIALREGDLLLFPSDAEHRISGQSTPPGPEIPVNQATAGMPEETSTSLICGYFEFEPRAWNPVIETLPAHIVLRSSNDPEADTAGTLIKLIVSEAESGGAGTGVLLDRLADGLFILAIRAVMRRDAPPTGVLAALTDRHLRLALSALHTAPADSWTIDGLAREAGLSRSAFAGRFHRITGMTPWRYLTRWRMQLARDWVRDRQLALIDVAERTGYGSEAAFNRAYKQAFGVTPGADRRGR